MQPGFRRRKTYVPRLATFWYDAPVRTMGEAQAAARVDDPLFSELYERSGAARLGLTSADFRSALDRILAKHFPAGAQPDVPAFLSRLRIEELALALACAAGSEVAWEEFLTRYRERLFDAARAIARDDVLGRELADSLYADLYAGSMRDGQRISKLSSYYGLGSLEGWLRTVLAQSFVDRYRAQRHNVSLEEQQDQGVQFAAAAADPDRAPDPRLNRAIDAALAEISAEDRYILACYFLDGRKLADIGRTLGVHESTVSRKLDRATVNLRKRIVEELRSAGMSRAQAEESLDADVRDLRVDVRRRLAQGPSGPAFLQGKGRKS
jgi:RNA polymerase sigma-70 factor (ECF subfamily)